MGRPNFHPSLQLPDPPGRQQVAQLAEKGEGPPGPRAGGPLPDGDKLIWVYVWIIQNGPDGRAAAAYGEYPGEEESQQKSGPLEGETWEIETEMAHDEQQLSDSFTAGMPALATAMALVQHSSGTPIKEVDWWSEPIMLDSAENFRGSTA